MTSVVRRREVAGALVTLAAVMWTGALAAQDAGQYTREQLQEMYLTYLKAEGYVPNVDTDGDIYFKVEGRTYLIFVNEKDPEFFRLAFINFWEIESEEERLKAYKMASEASAGTKVAKVYMVKNNMWASSEIFVEKPEDFKPVFKRSFSALKHAVETFASKMRE